MKNQQNALNSIGVICYLHVSTVTTAGEHFVIHQELILVCDMSLCLVTRNQKNFFAQSTQLY